MVSDPTNSDHTLNGALVVLVIALVGLIWRPRHPLKNDTTSTSLWYSLAFGSLALVTSDYLRWVSFGISIGSAFSYWRTTKQTSGEAVHPSRAARIFFSGLSFAAIALLLFYRLVPNYHKPLVWEGSVIFHYLDELKTFDLWKAFGARLLWVEGLFSEGDLSLLYGFPTAILLQTYSSLWSLRIFSVVYSLGAAALLYLACRRFSTVTVAITAIAVFGLNELTLIFGRYGSSISGTLFGILVALLACGSVVVQPTLPRTLCALVALFVATLGYAPARLVVVLLIVSSLIGVLRHRTASSKTKMLVIGALCSGVVLCAGVQKSFGRLDNFSSARQEQVLYLFTSDTWPDLMREQLQKFRAENRSPTTSDYVEFSKNLISSTTWRELQTILSPFTQSSSLHQTFYSDPLFLALYAPYLAPFLVLGCVMCARRSSRWFQGVMLGWVLVSTAPILLTNRVDSYRTSMLLIPLSVWISVGISEVVQELRRLRVFPSLLGIMLTASLSAVALSRVNQLSIPDVQPSSTDTIIESLEPRFLHQAVIGVDGQDFRSAAQTKLLLVRRQQQKAPTPDRVLALADYESLLSNGNAEVRRKTLNNLSTSLSRGAFAVLGPPARMKGTLSELQQMGFTVYPRTINDVEVVIVGQ